MVKRLSADDAAFFALSGRTGTATIGTVLIVERIDGGLDYRRLLSTVESRLPLAPHYRQRVRDVGWGLGRPVWVDDHDFDITYHVRRSALPTPGSDDQLHDLIARLLSRPLDRLRPLWEMNLIEGLSGGRMAIVTKTHVALIAGADSPEITEALIDDRADAAAGPAEDIWLPERAPGDVELVVGAITDLVAHPSSVAELARSTPMARRTRSTARRAVDRISRLADAERHGGLFGAPGNVARSYALGTVKVEDCKELARVRQVGLDDVLLSLVAGSLRRWMESHLRVLGPTEAVRVAVPLGLVGDGSLPLGEGEWTSGAMYGFTASLPVGEINPLVRFAQIGHQIAPLREEIRAAWRGSPVGEVIEPATFHALSARAFSGQVAPTFHAPLSIARRRVIEGYVAGNRVLGMYPVPALAPGHALSIAVTVYGDTIGLGFSAYRAPDYDIDALPTYVTESLDELAGHRGR